MSTALWLLGRGTGLVSLLLLTTTVVLGVLTGGGYRSRELPRFALTDIHRRVVIVTSLLRKHIRYAVWRGLHWIGYAVWPVAFLHGLGSGSDTGTWWLRSVAVACFAAVAVAAGWRVSRLEEPAAAPRPRAPSTPVG